MDIIPAQVWTQLGIGAVFLFLFVFMYREWRAERDKKDEQINNMTDRLMNAYVDNTRTQSGVSGAIDAMSKAIENNTSALNEIREKLCMGKTTDRT